MPPPGNLLVRKRVAEYSNLLAFPVKVRSARQRRRVGDGDGDRRNIGASGGGPQHRPDAQLRNYRLLHDLFPLYVTCRWRD